MRIVVISNLYPPLIQGGAEIVAQRMVSGLLSSGHDVAVISTRRFRAHALFRVEKQVEGGVSVYRFFPWNLYHYLHASHIVPPVRALWHVINIFNFHSSFIVKRILALEKPDVVITQNLMGMGFLIPRRIHRSNIKHFHVLHDVQLYNPSGVILFGHEQTFTQRLARMVGYPPLMRWLFKYTHAFIAPSRFLEMFYRERGFFKHQAVFVLPNPVTLPTLDEQLPGNKHFRIASMGGVSNAKGIPQACEALLATLHEHTIYYDIIGGGKELPRLHRRFAGEKHITFHGPQPLFAMERFYRNADLIVVPSILYDASPTVIYEALSYGVPVIAAASGGGAEVIKEGVTGWLFKPGDWEGLRKLIIHATTHRESLREMRTAARRSVESYSVNYYVNRLLEIIQK